MGSDTVGVGVESVLPVGEGVGVLSGVEVGEDVGVLPGVEVGDVVPVGCLPQATEPSSKVIESTRDRIFAVFLMIILYAEHFLQSYLGSAQIAV